MNMLEQLKQGLVFFDGAMGSVLQSRGLLPGELPEQWNLTHPTEIRSIHQAYLDAGCQIIKTNTFGANRLKLGDDLEQIVSAAVRIAREAVDAAGGYVALDIGPLGKVLRPLGDLPFEDAVDCFAEVVRIGAANGVDCILIETMNDAYETKAAVLAAKESASLPVFVTNVYDEDGKLMTGADPKAMVALLEGLRVDALGMNCSLGPHQMKQLLPIFLEYASVPVIVAPNAGLPRMDADRTVYDVSPEEFAACAAEFAAMGARMLGGCCGTTPEYLRRVVEAAGKVPACPLTKKAHTLISSYTHAVAFGEAPVLVGERINPTGKKRFKEALRDGDMAYILNEGLRQADCGVQVLDVNVGLPEIEEAAVMVRTVFELQSVTDLPLQIDTASPAVLEQALRMYNGKPLINSVNGKQENMDAVLPLAAKYGGVLIALTLDESGIPETAEGRAAIAAKIIRRAAEFGIEPKDIIVDPLTLTVSADPSAARVTLEAIRLIRQMLGVKTSLGVSNVSFGLPNRDFLNASFFAMALEAGLNVAILNPYSAEMMKTYYSCLALRGQDPDFHRYITFAEQTDIQTSVRKADAAPVGTSADLHGAIVRGLKETASRLTREQLLTQAPMEVVNSQIIPALDEVGKGFEQKTIYLPQLLMSAEAAAAAFEAVKEVLKSSQACESRGKIVLATVKGDIHDIGKNIVKVLLENYGFTVIDLGRDVPPEAIAEAACKHQVRLVGLSALMTTTVPAMAQTVRLLQTHAPQCRVVVGGAVLTAEYAQTMGADHYAKDAMEAVRYAEELFNT